MATSTGAGRPGTSGSSGVIGGTGSPGDLRCVDLCSVRGRAGLRRVVPRVGPYARRVEMIWYGQEQAPSWLEEQGWRPVTTDEDWVRLGREARRSHDTARSRSTNEDSA